MLKKIKIDVPNLDRITGNKFKERKKRKLIKVEKSNKFKKSEIVSKSVPKRWSSS